MENDSLQKIQALEQAVHTHTVQRQSYEAQLHELDHARTELAETTEAYRIVGGIMVQTDPKKLVKDFDEKHTTLKGRVAALQKQEQHLKGQMEALRKELVGESDE